MSGFVMEKGGDKTEDGERMELMEQRGRYCESSVRKSEVSGLSYSFFQDKEKMCRTQI